MHRVQAHDHACVGVQARQLHMMMHMMMHMVHAHVHDAHCMHMMMRICSSVCVLVMVVMMHMMVQMLHAHGDGFFPKTVLLGGSVLKDLL